MKRLFQYLAYAALAALATIAIGAYLIYRSLLPAELPARPTPTLPPLVRGAVLTLLGPTANATVARLHLDALERRGALPRVGYQKARLRVSALSKWLSIHFSADEVAEAYATLVRVGDDDRAGLAAEAQALFGKPLQQLAPHEIALLMTVAYSPRDLDPACHPEEARRARDALLNHMAEDHLIPPDAVAAQQAMPVRVLAACPEEAPDGNQARGDR